MKIMGYVAVIASALLAGVCLLTPVPGALLVRALFNKDGRRVTAALADNAPLIDVRAEIAYREGDRDALLDIYSPPTGDGPAPTIIWTHGGAWLSGAKGDYAGYYARLAEAGFNIVSLGYSIAPGHRYPTAVHQLNDAHDFLLANAAEYRIDPDNILLAGDSAGSQLSAQLATAITNPSYAASLGVVPALAPNQLKGVILNCGIYDISKMGGGGGLAGWGVEQALWAYTGRRSFADSTAGAEMSTINWVDKNFPATYISGGNADPLTATQSRPFAHRLAGLGVAVSPVFYPDDHESELAHEYQFDLSTEAARAALDKTIDFAHRVTD
ncbi:alpha/beta hydrolase [Corynebacterium sp. A21]|uniref:alpha/beta hydrolase n=1 Tax=Corynebacterium sp. A21 TaxID=3457318 RepID=UPI003FD095DC